MTFHIPEISYKMFIFLFCIQHTYTPDTNHKIPSTDLENKISEVKSDMVIRSVLYTQSK